MMDIRAEGKYIRVSPQKARLVAEAVRRLPLERAMTFLETLPRRSAGPMRKVIGSAIANAQNNHKISRTNLFIRSIAVDEGTFFKRFRAVSRGMAHGYEKRTSHITVVLGIKKEGIPQKDTKKPVKQVRQTRTKASDVQPVEKISAPVEKHVAQERIKPLPKRTIVPRQVTRQKKGM